MSEDVREATRLAWTAEKPTQPGLYLRTTDWGRVVHAELYCVEGELRMVLANCVGPSGVAVKATSWRWQWFGPIPRPPSVQVKSPIVDEDGN